MALESYEFKFFAHCGEDGHDKIWGFVEFKNAPEDTRDAWMKKNPRWYPPEPGSLYNFWGPRGKWIKFKRHYGAAGAHDLEKLASKKLYPSGDKTPYKKISIQDIEKICPGFAEEFENQLLLAKFSNAVKSDDTENNTFI